jgi:hypothetical protein
MPLEHILKNSSQSGKEPSPSQLDFGEIALNYHADDPFLTCKDTSGAVRRLTYPPGTGGGGGGTGGGGIVPSTGQLIAGNGVAANFAHQIQTIDQGVI